MSPAAPSGACVPDRRGALRLAMRGAAAALVVGLAAVVPAGAAETKTKGGGASYIQFDTLTASVTRLDGRRGVMSVEGGVDVPDAALRSRAERSRPLLRDAYVRWLATYGASLSPGAPPNADEIAEQLQRRTDQVLGRAGARFLIGTVMVN